jgi:two-component system response regulator FixJ
MTAVLAENLHDPTVMGDVVVVGQDLAYEATIRHVEDCAEPVRIRLVGAEQPEIRWVVLVDVAKIAPEDRERLYDAASGLLATLGSALPGCVVTDVRMPVIDGLELLRRLKAAGSSLPVIVMTGHGDVALAVEAMKAGAVDFIEKPFDDELFLKAVRSCFQNRSATDSGAVATRLKVESLSRRERQVLDGVLAGKQNKIIAHELGLSPRTVEVHRAKVMTKTEANNLPDLVRAMLGGGYE